VGSGVQDNRAANQSSLLYYYLTHTHYDLWVVITSLPVTSSHHASRTKVTN